MTEKIICPNCLEEVPRLSEHAYVFGTAEAEYICLTSDAPYPDTGEPDAPAE